MAKKSRSAASSSKGNAPTSAANTAQSASQDNSDAVSMLTEDHRKVEQLFERYGQQSSSEDKASTAKEIAKELIIHTMLEEHIFYPACRDQDVDVEILNEAQVEHDGAKVLVSQLLAYDPEDEYSDAKVTVLAEYIRHHVAEEEKPQEGIFAKAKAAGMDLKAVGRQLQTLKSELLQKAQAGALPSPPTRSFDLESNRSMEERDMERRYERERDDEGRFVSSERGYRGYSQNRDNDYGRGSAGGRGHGGWSGDPEGHSEASERGWEGQRGGYGSRGRNENYDDERSSSRGGYRSRDEDDDYRSSSRGRGHGGWFGDSEGHSEARHRGWEERGGRRGDSYDSGGGRDYEDERSSGRGGGGGRGWYGDPEGHSRASQEGWEHRGGGGRRPYSRSDEDDGGSRSSRSGSRGGHGGWFGDPEGHSRASEEGWEHRGGRSFRSRQ